MTSHLCFVMVLKWQTALFNQRIVFFLPLPFIVTQTAAFRKTLPAASRAFPAFRRRFPAPLQKRFLPLETLSPSFQICFLARRFQEISRNDRTGKNVFRRCLNFITFWRKTFDSEFKLCYSESGLQKPRPRHFLIFFGGII